MKISSLADVHDAIGEIQRKQGSDRTLRNLNRIKGFLECMKHYEQLVKVFLNVSIVPYIWVGECLKGRGELLSAACDLILIG